MWGSFELNSQMAPSLSQVCVLATLTMSSFALETREECTGHVNPWFLQQRRAQDWKTAWWLPLLFRFHRSRHTSFIFFSLLDECHWDRGIEWKRLLSPKHAVLQIPPKTDLPAFCNDFESHYRIFAHILLRSKTILVIWWCYRPTRLILCYCSVVGPEKANFTDFETS